MGKAIWNIIEGIAHFFVYGFLKIIHKDLSEERWKTLMQFVKFGLVGVSNTVVTYVTYAILVFFGLHYQLANLIGYIAGILNSYFWNNKYVFTLEEGQKRNHFKALAKVFASYGATYFVEAGLLFVWVSVLKVNAFLAPIVSLLVTIPLNFIMSKLWAFKAERK